jgi:hypothetical protein
LLLAQKIEDAVPVVKKNIIKVNLSSIAFKNASLQYERVLKPKMSFALGVSIMPKSSLPFAKTLKDEFSDNEDAMRAIETTELSNFSITPELRFYLSKKGAPQGFYIAPYARYAKMSFEQLYQFTASNNKVYKPVINGDINFIGGGLMFGAQWSLSKSITLDWWILGAHTGSTSGLLSGTADMSDLTAADKQDLENDIEDVDLPLLKTDATVSSNKVDVKFSGGYVGARAFGFALGIKF